MESRKQPAISFRKLLLDISKSITDEQYEELIYLAECEQNGFKHKRDLFSYLHKEGIFDEGNVDRLEELLGAVVDGKDLVDRVNTYKSQYVPNTSLATDHRLEPFETPEPSIDEHSSIPYVVNTVKPIKHAGIGDGAAGYSLSQSNIATHSGAAGCIVSCSTDGQHVETAQTTNQRKVQTRNTYMPCNTKMHDNAANQPRVQTIFDNNTTGPTSLTESWDLVEKPTNEQTLDEPDVSSKRTRLPVFKYIENSSNNKGEQVSARTDNSSSKPKVLSNAPEHILQVKPDGTEKTVPLVAHQGSDSTNYDGQSNAKNITISSDTTVTETSQVTPKQPLRGLQNTGRTTTNDISAELAHTSLENSIHQHTSNDNAAKSNILINQSAECADNPEPIIKLVSDSFPTDSAENDAVVKLYNYQIELSRRGVVGKNNIICAPTGSGKTLTAGFVCEKLREHAHGNNDKFNAVFIVCIRNLVEQQKKELQKCFKNEDPVTTVDNLSLREILKAEHMEEDNSQTRDTSDQKNQGNESEEEEKPMKRVTTRKDVVVLTAQKFLNELEEWNLSILDFDLLIFDECHHTDLQHPYNKIMRLYQKEKRTNENKKLPVIMGLTASLGAGADSTVPKALDQGQPDSVIQHYVKICANLDCSHITYVKEHVGELMRHNPQPDDNQIMDPPARPDNDKYHLMLIYLANEIGNKIEFPKLSKSRPHPARQDFVQWAVTTQRECETQIPATPESRGATLACKVLKKIGFIIQYHKLHRSKEVNIELKRFFEGEFFSEVTPTNPLPAWSFMKELYERNKDELNILADREELGDNQQLETLVERLEMLYEEEPYSKGILLTRTIFSAHALKAMIEGQEELKGIVKAKVLVGQSKKDKTMTHVEQKTVIENFRDNEKINLLIATDVAQEGLDIPKCNFVIRYNFVSNEIGSVQARGRARAKNSRCYLIVPKGSPEIERERKNQKNEHRMLQALSDIEKFDREKVEKMISEKQDELWRDYETMLKNRQKGFTQEPKDVTIVCRSCNSDLCNGTDLVKKGGNQYICIAEEFPGRITTHNLKKQEDYKYDRRIGESFCVEETCRKPIGPIFSYKFGSRALGYLLSKENIALRFADPDWPLMTIRKWSSVPFYIPDEKYTS